MRPPGNPHADCISPAGALNLDLQLSSELLDSCRLASGHAFHVTHVRLPTIAARLRAELRASDRAQPLMLESFALEIAAIAIRDRTRERSAPAWLWRVLDRIEADPFAELDTSDLARDIGVHALSLSLVLSAPSRES